MFGRGPAAGSEPEWRNWQTRRTQNPVGFTARVGSIPSSGTNVSLRSPLLTTDLSDPIGPDPTVRPDPTRVTRSDP
jgi:hypothetical protein